MPHGIRASVERKDGLWKNRSLAKRKPASISNSSVHEMPHVTPIIVESSDPEGPFGAKEAGEGPLFQFFLRSLTQFTMP